MPSFSNVSINNISCFLVPVFCVGFLVESLLLACIGVVKGCIILLPVAVYTIPSWIFVTAINWPTFLVAAYTTAAATRCLGPNLRTLVLLLLPVPLVVWPVAIAASSIVFTLFVGFLWPLLATVAMGSLLEGSKVLRTAVAEPLSATRACTVALWVFTNADTYTYLAILRQPYYGEPLDVSVLRLLISVMLSLLCSLLGAAAVLCLGLLRLPFIIARSLGEWVALLNKCRPRLICLWLPLWVLGIPAIPVVAVILFMLLFIGNLLYLGPSCGVMAYLETTSRPAHRSFAWALFTALDVLYGHIYALDEAGVRLTGLGSSTLLPMPSQRTYGRRFSYVRGAVARNTQLAMTDAAIECGTNDSPQEHAWSTFEDLCAASVQRALRWGWVPPADLADSEAYLFIGLPALALLQLLADAAAVPPNWMPDGGVADGEEGGGEEDGAAAAGKAMGGDKQQKQQPGQQRQQQQPVAAGGNVEQVLVGVDDPATSPGAAEPAELPLQPSVDVVAAAGVSVTSVLAGIRVAVGGTCPALGSDAGSVILHDVPTDGGDGGGRVPAWRDVDSSSVSGVGSCRPGGGGGCCGGGCGWEESAAPGGEAGTRAFFMLQQDLPQLQWGEASSKENGMHALARAGLAVEAAGSAQRGPEGTEMSSSRSAAAAPADAAAAAATIPGGAAAEVDGAGGTAGDVAAGDVAAEGVDLISPSTEAAAVAAAVPPPAEVAASGGGVAVVLGQQWLEPGVAAGLLEELAEHLLSADIGFTSAANPVRLHKSLAALQATPLEIRYMACHTILLGDPRVGELVPLEVAAARPPTGTGQAGHTASGGPVDVPTSGAGESAPTASPAPASRRGSRPTSGPNLPLVSPLTLGSGGGIRPDSGGGLRLFGRFSRDSGAPSTAAGAGAGGCVSAPHSPSLAALTTLEGQTAAAARPVPGVAPLPPRHRRGRSSLGGAVAAIAFAAAAPSAGMGERAGESALALGDAGGSFSAQQLEGTTAAPGTAITGTAAATANNTSGSAAAEAGSVAAGAAPLEPSAVAPLGVAFSEPTKPVPANPLHGRSLSGGPSAPPTPPLHVMVCTSDGASSSVIPTAALHSPTGAAPAPGPPPPPAHNPPASSGYRWPFGKGHHRRSRSQPVGMPVVGLGLVPPSPRSVPGGEGPVTAAAGALAAAAGGGGGHRLRASEAEGLGSRSGTADGFAQSGVGGAAAGAAGCEDGAAGAAAGAGEMVSEQRLAQLHAFTAAVQSVATALSKKARMKEIMGRLLVRYGGCGSVCGEGEGQEPRQ